MAAVSEDISDRELRAKLKENGISCGPITATTKNLYIRKLRNKLSEDESALSSGKVPSRKSLSPKPSSRRASPSRRSVDPTPPSGRKLIGFSSDEDESAKEPVTTRQKRLSGQFKGSPRKSTAFTPIQNEERPVFRRRSNNTSSPKYKLRQDGERTDIDGRVNMNSYAFEPKRGKLPSYAGTAGLRNLFLKKSMEDSKKYANTSPPPPPEVTYDLEVEDETDKNSYQYTWLIWVLVIALVVVFLLVYNWQFLSAMLWNGVSNDQLKICGPSFHGNENEACLSEEDITEKLVEHLQYELGTMLGLSKCGYSTKDGKMTRAELEKWVNERLGNKHCKDKVVKNIKEYILQNPGFSLRCADKNGTDDKGSIFKSFLSTAVPLRSYNLLCLCLLRCEVPLDVARTKNSTNVSAC
ncbi:Hypothetical predicted protein [Paramuricea clavata]|uniref:Uncharacterized protein n=1 Tax=Paramuricea clavata TaxID=317549 RepID=A0A7D9IJY7_PARCT|nr:Hypothetical predicted protein [Paramuricea clavata]